MTMSICSSGTGGFETSIRSVIARRKSQLIAQSDRNDVHGDTETGRKRRPSGTDEGTETGSSTQ